MPCDPCYPLPSAKSTGGGYHLPCRLSSSLSVLTIMEAAQAIRAGRLSPVELTERCLTEAQRLNPVLHAFNVIAADEARAAARVAERELMQGRDRGPLHGIPFGVKDVYDVARLPTTGYSRSRLSLVAQSHATAVQRLIDAGAIFIGKLATHEFANGGPSFDLPWPPARNPWDTRRVTGGSSTGAGAAIAAGILPAALGTDTGGSIRIPASLCGIAGLKPTFGRVSRAGVITHSPSLDHCGPLAWTVADCAVLFDALAGADPRDPACSTRAFERCRPLDGQDLRGLRIGVVRHFWEQDSATAPALAAAMDEALRALSSLGAQIETVTLPPLQHFHDVKTVITKFEVFAEHRTALAARLQDFGADFLGMTLAGALYTPDDYALARGVQAKLAAEMSEALAHCDLLVTASSGPAAPFASYGPARVIDHWTKPNRETPFSVTGAPALALSIGFDDDGLPLGMQIAGRAFDERTVLQAGHAYELATTWRQRRPVVSTKVHAAPAPAAITAAPSNDPLLARAIEALHAHGIEPADSQRAQLAAVAQHALAAAQRLRETHAVAE